MSREIRRLHRKQTQFINFSGTQIDKLSDSIESVEQNNTDTSDQSLRKRRRRTNNSEVDISLITPTKPSSFINTEAKSDDASSIESQVTINSTTTNTTSHQATIDRIRSEINEDQYHCSLNEADYSNDTHDWGDDHDNISSDYWHFLGQYE